MRRFTCSAKPSSAVKLTSSSHFGGWSPSSFSVLQSSKVFRHFHFPWWMHQFPQFHFTSKHALYCVGVAFSLYGIQQRYDQQQLSALWSNLPSVTFVPPLENDPFSTTPNISFSRQLNEAEMYNLERILRFFYPNSKPNMFTISEMQSWAEPDSELSVNSSSDGESVSYYILEGVDSAVAPHLPAMANSIRQLASQFSLGEDPNKDSPTHPSEFKYDHTQGPAEQAASVVAALLRWIHRKDCDGMANLLRYPEFTELFDYQNGYLTPKLDCEVEALKFLEAHVGEIQLNVQRVRVDGSNHPVLQVLTAAPALGPYDTYATKRSENGHAACRDISEVLLVAQYKALAGVAVNDARRNKSNGQRTSCVLTPLGGGVFGNDPVVIKKGVHAYCEVIEKSGEKNVDVCLSAYQAEEAELYRTRHFKDAPIIDEVGLSRLSQLSDAAVTSARLHQSF